LHHNGPQEYSANGSWCVGWTWRRAPSPPKELSSSWSCRATVMTTTADELSSSFSCVKRSLSTLFGMQRCDTLPMLESFLLSTMRLESEVPLSRRTEWARLLLDAVTSYATGSDGKLYPQRVKFLSVAQLPRRYRQERDEEEGGRLVSGVVLPWTMSLEAELLWRRRCGPDATFLRRISNSSIFPSAP
jgi:hypothetical protein